MRSTKNPGSYCCCKAFELADPCVVSKFSSAISQWLGDTQLDEHPERPGLVLANINAEREIVTRVDFASEAFFCDPTAAVATLRGRPSRRDKVSLCGQGMGHAASRVRWHQKLNKHNKDPPQGL
jgi:hypothetical protein